MARPPVVKGAARSHQTAVTKVLRSVAQRRLPEERQESYQEAISSQRRAILMVWLLQHPPMLLLDPLCKSRHPRRLLQRLRVHLLGPPCNSRCHPSLLLFLLLHFLDLPFRCRRLLVASYSSMCQMGLCLGQYFKLIPQRSQDQGLRVKLLAFVLRQMLRQVRLCRCQLRPVRSFRCKCQWALSQGPHFRSGRLHQCSGVLILQWQGRSFLQAVGRAEVLCCTAHMPLVSMRSRCSH
mmetsp:Transcript_144025/g.359075  ORF Transcript_144025/g.359075 Transcript_144025/m.359075 type:complete len:237 (+) Transcript_144025:2853-3563(+)